MARHWDARAVPRFTELNIWDQPGEQQVSDGVLLLSKEYKEGRGPLVGGEKTSYSAFSASSWETKTKTTHVPCVTHSYRISSPNPKQLLQIILQMWIATTTVCRLTATVGLIFDWQNLTHIVLWSGPLLVTVVGRMATIPYDCALKWLVPAPPKWHALFTGCLHFKPFCRHQRDDSHTGMGPFRNFELRTAPVPFLYIRSVTTILNRRQTEELYGEGLTFLPFSSCNI